MKPPSQVRIGLSSDEVLKLRGRSEEHVIANPKVVGQENERLIVEWYYGDCTVVLRYDGTRYRVSEVKDVSSKS